MVAPIISSTGVLRQGAPARKAMSASPVASITRFASTAWRPDLLSVITPWMAPPSRMGATAVQCSRGCTPALVIISSATNLKLSASSAWLSDCGSFCVPP